MPPRKAAKKTAKKTVAPKTKCMINVRIELPAEVVAAAQGMTTKDGNKHLQQYMKETHNVDMKRFSWNAPGTAAAAPSAPAAKAAAARPLQELSDDEDMEGDGLY